MLRRKWILALCGVVGAATTMGIVLAQDRFEPREQSFGQSTPTKRSVTYFSRSGKSGEQTITKNKPTATSDPGKRAGKSPFDSGSERPSRLWTFNRRLGEFQPADGSASKSAVAGKSRSKVVRAEFTRTGKSRGEVRQISSISGNVSPYKTVPAPLPSGKPASFARTRGNVTTISPAKINFPAGRVTKTVSTGPQTPTVTVEWVKMGDINVGHECACNLIVKNSGRTVAENVALMATFPSSVRLTSAKPMPVERNGRLHWNFASLAPGEKKVIQFKMIPSRRGPLQATASVRFTGTALESFDVQEPMLKLTITGAKEVLVGDSASQIIRVSNPGTGIATNVKIEARIPKGLEHPRGERLIMEVGSLNPGESRTVRLTLSAIEGGKQTIHVEARSDVALRRQLAKLVLVTAPSIKIAMKGPGLRYIGRNAVYVISVTNDGTGDTNNVRVLHRIPAGFQFVRADKGGKFESRKRMLSWFIGRVEPGKTVNVKVELKAKSLGKQEHLVGAISEQGAKAETKLTTNVDGSSSLVLEIVDLDDPVEVGTETAYEVRVRNSGTKAAFNVKITCELPAGVILISAKGPTSSIAENGLVIFKSLAQLRPGKTALYRISVRGKIAGNHRFRVRLVSKTIRNPLTYEELTKFYVD
ncbi:MAG: DUF11 domain-containing protein [Planctomycetes bacterium]|nr:DUF11 domain-containing protein [Planctomycetota bacterium]